MITPKETWPPPPKETWIVTYVLQERASTPTFTDHYEVFKSLDDAESRYSALLCERDLWSASISKVWKSTDYQPGASQVPTKREGRWIADRGLESPNKININVRLKDDE